MKKILVSELSTVVVDESSVSVAGWVPAERDPDNDVYQEYELVFPEDLESLTYYDLSAWSAKELVAWIKRYDACRTGYVDALILKRPRSGSSEYELWVEDLQDVVRDSIDEVRTDYEESCAPMMNYYYPLGRYQPSEDAAVLAGTNCSLVYLPDRGIYALVLNGGGMDFSWEIALAHIRLGYLPPAWITLPLQAGYPKQAKLIMAACARSQRVLMERAMYGLERLQCVCADVKKQVRR